MAKTLYDKLWDSHVVDTSPDGSSLLYIDRHLLHEVTSPQAFEGLALAGRNPWRLPANLAVPDHNVPTSHRDQPIADPISRQQVEALGNNCRQFNIHEIPMNDIRQGIVHVIGPEQGFTQPGITIVCGDSHTSTHGAFAALAFGIGTSEVEHVLATQCLVMQKAKNFLAHWDGQLQPGVYAKDLVLDFIGKIGTAGGTGYTIEFAGNAIRALSMEGRMTVCNMAIEAGARSGLVAVDDTTIDYVMAHYNGKDRVYAPSPLHREAAIHAWRKLFSDDRAIWDFEMRFDASTITPQVTWGTSPEMVAPIHAKVPALTDMPNEVARSGMEKALEYMNLQPEQPMVSIAPNKIFIGSCTNSRLEDLRVAANVVKGKKIAKNIELALVVPGSGSVKAQAEREGLADIFRQAGFEWRDPGCSMCLGMNPDVLNRGDRCASTSNRNFEGRQGAGGRTHLVSPAMAAAAAIHGHFVDVRAVG